MNQAKTCSLYELLNKECGRRGPDPENPGLQTWNPEVPNLKNVNPDIPKFKKTIP